MRKLAEHFLGLGKQGLKPGINNGMAARLKSCPVTCIHDGQFFNQRLSIDTGLHAK